MGLKFVGVIGNCKLYNWCKFHVKLPLLFDWAKMPTKHPPSFITIDSEQAAILAVKLIFPNAIIRGCHFHFNKCIYTQLQDLGFQSALVNKKPSDINEINMYKKS